MEFEEINYIRSKYSEKISATALKQLSRYFSVH